MKRTEFMSEAYRALQDFEKSWNRGQREDGEELWPEEMGESDWWEQLIAHIEYMGEEG